MRESLKQKQKKTEPVQITQTSDGYIQNTSRTMTAADMKQVETDYQVENGNEIHHEVPTETTHDVGKLKMIDYNFDADFIREFSRRPDEVYNITNLIRNPDCVQMGEVSDDNGLFMIYLIVTNQDLINQLENRSGITNEDASSGFSLILTPNGTALFGMGYSDITLLPEEEEALFERVSTVIDRQYRQWIPSANVWGEMIDSKIKYQEEHPEIDFSLPLTPTMQKIVEYQKLLEKMQKQAEEVIKIAETAPKIFKQTPKYALATGIKNFAQKENERILENKQPNVQFTIQEIQILNQIPENEIVQELKTMCNEAIQQQLEELGTVNPREFKHDYFIEQSMHQYVADKLNPKE